MTMLAIPAYRYTKYLVAGGIYPQKELIISVVFIFLINVIMIIVPLLLGAKSFVRREF